MTSNPASTKTFVEFKGLPASARWFSLIHSHLEAMRSQVRLDAARATLRHEEGVSPAYTAQVHLEVPGPDIKVAGSGFTLMEAWRKACEQIREVLRRRDEKRALARKRSGLRRAPAAC